MRNDYHHQRPGVDVDVTLRISQVVSACTFCKSRKIKCDGASPCSGCTKFKREAACSLVAGTARHSHDYVAHLQNRIQQMRALFAVGSSTPMPGGTQSNATGEPDRGEIETNKKGDGRTEIATDAHQPQKKCQELHPRHDRLVTVTARQQEQNQSMQGMQKNIHLIPSVIDTLIIDIGALPISTSVHHGSTATGGSGPTLSTILLAAAGNVPLLDIQQETQQQNHHMDIKYSLPDQSAAIKLAKHYIQQVYPRLPFFSLQGFWAQFNHVYSNDCRDTNTSGTAASTDTSHDSGYSYFTVLLVLAISTSSLSRSADSMISNQARRLFQAGLQFRESAILPNTIVGVQSLLFLIQFATLNPSVLDSWYLIGVGMRNCVDLGLHQDPPSPGKEKEASADATSSSLLETRRRLWWSMYSFDRSMSIGCGRPTEIADVLINVQLPSFSIESTATEVEIEGYLQRYRSLELQSEIYDALNLPPTSNSEGTSPQAIVSSLHDRLNTWQKANRPERNSHTLADSEWLMSKMLLFRPCRLLPERSPNELYELWISSRGFTTLYRQLVESNGIFYVQIGCEKVYWTGLVVLYSYWRLHSADYQIREKPELLDLWKATKDIAFILQTLGERWEDGKLLSTRFDSVSARVIELISRDHGGSDMSEDVHMPSEVLMLSSYASLVSIWASGEQQTNSHTGGMTHSEELQDLVAKMI